jgi:hypothetical protein
MSRGRLDLVAPVLGRAVMLKRMLEVDMWVRLTMDWPPPGPERSVVDYQAPDMLTGYVPQRLGAERWIVDPYTALATVLTPVRFRFTGATHPQQVIRGYLLEEIPQNGGVVGVLLFGERFAEPVDIGGPGELALQPRVGLVPFPAPVPLEVQTRGRVGLVGR